MSEVKGTCGTLFERVTGSGDMVQMQSGAFANDVLNGIFIKTRQFVRPLFDLLEKRAIADQGNFDGLHVSGAFLGSGQASKKAEIVDHRIGYGEGAHPILLSKEIDPVLYANSSVSLTQTGSGKTNRRMPGGRKPKPTSPMRLRLR